ncbi:MAG: hypothetical protein J6X60_02065, partial [Ruminiclostridium sp.]|nr:hypothetical protein [Ruminiclostridium sp.]
MKSKQIAGLMLSGAMMLSLAGCGGTPATTTAAPAATTAAPAATTAAPAATTAAPAATTAATTAAPAPSGGAVDLKAQSGVTLD